MTEDARQSRRHAGTLQSERDVSVVRSLFIHTPTESTLGADVWVHAQIMRRLDRSANEVHLALARSSPDAPTPLARELADVADIRRLEVNPGRERSQGSSVLASVRHAAGAVWWVIVVARLIRYVRKQRIDVIHTCDRPRDAAAAVIVGRLTRVPSIVHVHVAHGDWMSRTRRWAIASADHRITVSGFVRQSLIASGSPATSTHTVLNGVDPTRWRPDPRASAIEAEFDLPDGVPVVVTVCRLFEAKGVLELVDAFATLRTEARLLIVGADGSSDGSYRSRLEARSAELGITDRVSLAGWRDDVPAFLTASDVFAMPSTGEPCAIAYLEAMAMGLAIVALDNGGTPELIEHDREGLLSSYGDVGGLSENLRRVVEDDELRARLGRTARDRVAGYFTTDRQAADVAALYRRVIVEF